MSQFESKQTESTIATELNQIADPERRKMFRKVAVASGLIAGAHFLPGKWAKPVVDKVILPAHAQTSTTYSINDPCNIELVSGDGGSASVTVVVDGFITPAMAGVEVIITMTAVGGAGSSEIVTVTTAADGTYSSGDVIIGGGPGITDVDVTTAVMGSTASCSVVVPPRDTVEV